MSVYQSVWVQDLGLFDSDKYVLLSRTQWLNDNIINCSQKLISSECSYKEFQNTQLGKKLSFKKIEWTDQFIQILHTGNHWPTVSNVNCIEGSVNVYDSKYKHISKDTLRQICSFLRSKYDVVKFHLVNIQTQPNDCDCGVFAIAVAMELAVNSDPSKFRYNVSQMRNHLLDCFEARKISIFPKQSDRNVTEKYVKVVIEPVYCICRMPFDERKHMRRCNNCCKPYHGMCS